MKKSRPNLALRKETLRALSGIKLAHAVGGQVADVRLDLTFDRDCPAPAFVLKG